MRSEPTPPYRERRARVAAALRAAGGGVAILQTAPERQRSGDTDHPYRHGSDFHYLTGFAEPGGWLAIGADGRTTLACRPKDVQRELWDGIRLGPEAAPAALGIDEAVVLDALDETMVARLAGAPAVWWTFDSPEVGAHVQRWLERVRAGERGGLCAPHAQNDLAPLLA
ncbi:MAG: aminopeptidase P N-terminal domain-containing protein, partial [Caldimonas sp.]